MFIFVFEESWQSWLKFESHGLSVLYYIFSIAGFFIAGHVSSTYVERLKGISLVVRSEADGSLLLESKVSILAVY
jgi:hypothetical protein